MISTPIRGSQRMRALHRANAVRTGRYLQLTNDGYVGALRVRTDELLAGGLPELPYFD